MEGDDNVSSCTDTDTLPAVDTEEEELDKVKEADKEISSSQEEREAKKKAWEAEWKKKLESLKKDKSKGKKKRDSGESGSGGTSSSVSVAPSNEGTSSSDPAADVAGKDAATTSSRKIVTPEPPAAPQGKKRKLADTAETEKPSKRSARETSAEKKMGGEVTTRSRGPSMEKEAKQETKKSDDAETKSTTTTTTAVAANDVAEGKAASPVDSAPSAEAKAEEDRKKLMRLKTREMLKTLMKHGSIVYQPLCTCKIPGTTFTVIQHPLCCQALDSVDDKLVACNGKVTGKFWG